MKAEDANHALAVEGRFLELLKTFHAGILITRTGGDALRGRPMSIGHVEDDGVLWFFTDTQSGKVAELGRDQRVVVTLAEGDKYIVMTGAVELVRDAEKARALWKEQFRVWFSGPDDPKLVLLRFEPVEGEYWNNAGAQGLKQAFRAAKAYVQGEQLKDIPDPGLHGKVHR